MIPESSISVAANELRTMLASSITDLDAGRVSISHPEEIRGDKNRHGLNLFFYRVEPGGYPADGTGDDPFFVRLHCLITALGGGDNTISSGENDLRLIGEVMRVLHERPIIPVSNPALPLRLQAVFLPLNLGDMNHLWSTQGKAVYRISVAYEFYLVPVPLAATVSTRSPRVGAVGVRVDGNLSKKILPPADLGVTGRSPRVPRVEVNTSHDNWTPHICFVGAHGSLHYTLQLPDTGGARERDVLIAGAVGTEVALAWERWDWTGATNEGEWIGPVPDERTPSPTIAGPGPANVIDPDAIDDGMKHTVRLPFDLSPASAVGSQGLLYASRKVQRSSSSGSTEISLRSNPLLVSVFHPENG